jgi:hypothetical protein
MTLPARDVEAAVNARVLASEGSQDIWAEASQHVPQHYEPGGSSKGMRGGQAGYTELGENIAEFKRALVMRLEHVREQISSGTTPAATRRVSGVIG